MIYVILYYIILYYVIYREGVVAGEVDAVAHPVAGAEEEHPPKLLLYYI